MTAVAELFAARIDRARHQCGWSVAELARKSGLKTTTVRHILWPPQAVKRGHSGPAWSSAAALAAALSLNLDDLAAPASCATCDGMPPAPFTCPDCGAGSPAQAKSAPGGAGSGETR